ncbi:MAG: EFR1 family ferrodoxin [Porphyromonadaceae bacterium]|nr:EFR1 family ferrodoxin [Porphyromonadaceae bacterium]
MVVYFSATGNSKWVARQIGFAFGLSVQMIFEEKGCRETLFSGDEPLFLVFPVHAWGPAITMYEFIQEMSVDGYRGQPIYAVCVCGDDCGRTDKIVAQALRRRGMCLTAVFSVQMPDSYILLPGFDVDEASVVAEKLQDAPARLEAIVKAIKQGGKASLYHAGALPRLKSLVHPLFRWYARRGNSFYATAACTMCGKCIRLCPTHTIVEEASGRPCWKKKGCTQCLACIHRCPQRAIEYGHITLRKGRYHHPDTF